MKNLAIDLGLQADYMKCKKQVSEIFSCVINIGSLGQIHLNSVGHVWEVSN